MRPVIFKDSAVQDLQKAYSYLEEQGLNLGEKLLEKITEYIEVLETNPFIFHPEYRQIRHCE